MGFSGKGARYKCIRCESFHSGELDDRGRPTMTQYCKDCRYEMQQIAKAREAAASKQRGKPLTLTLPPRPSDWTD